MRHVGTAFAEAKLNNMGRVGIGPARAITNSFPCTLRYRSGRDRPGQGRFLPGDLAANSTGEAWRPPIGSGQRGRYARFAELAVRGIAATFVFFVAVLAPIVASTTCFRNRFVNGSRENQRR